MGKAPFDKSKLKRVIPTLSLTRKKISMSRLLAIILSFSFTCVYGVPTDLLYFDNATQPGEHAGVFGVAIDPLDQSIYAWAQGYGTIPACGIRNINRLEAYLIKFKNDASSIIWCRAYRDKLATTADHRINMYHLWSGNNGPVVDPESGGIFVYGTYRNSANEEPLGIFLLKYNRTGHLLDTLQNDAGKTDALAAGLFLDATNGVLYAGSTTNAVSYTYESFITKFNAETGELLMKQRMDWNGLRYPAITALVVHGGVIYCTGSKSDGDVPFFGTAWAVNLTARNSAWAYSKKGSGYTITIDADRNSVYVGGTSEETDSVYVNRTYWKFNLRSLQPLQTVVRAGDGINSDAYYFSLLHPTTKHAVYFGGQSTEGRTFSDVKLSVVSTANGSQLGEYQFNNLKSNIGYSAQFNSSGYLIIGTSFYNNLRSNWSISLMGLKNVAPLPVTTTSHISSTASRLSSSSIPSTWTSVQFTTTAISSTNTSTSTATSPITSLSTTTTVNVTTPASTITTPSTTSIFLFPSSTIFSSDPITLSPATTRSTLTDPDFSSSQTSSLARSSSTTANNDGGQFKITPSKIPGPIDTIFNNDDLTPDQISKLTLAAIITACVAIILIIIAVFFYALRRARRGGRRMMMAVNKNVAAAAAPASISTVYSATETKIPNFTRVTDTKSLQLYSTVSTAPLDTTLYQTRLKALSIPGSFAIQQPATDFILLRAVTRTGNGALFTAAPNSSELIARSKNRTLAVKQVNVKNALMMESFYLELSIMYYFHENPRFVEMVGFTSHYPFSIVTIFYPCGSLDDFYYKEKGEVIPTKRVWIIFASQIVEAIQIMHQAGFAHCDLKPHNVMIEACSDDDFGYRCRLGDFGLTRPLDDQHRQVKAFNFDSLAGLTVVYAAPEAIMRFRRLAVLHNSSDYYLQCDIYSLGVMLYELIVCRLAWR